MELQPGRDGEDDPKRRPLDVFTATALVQHKIEARKIKNRATPHVPTAPESVKEAFDALGIPQPSTAADTVWSCVAMGSEDTVIDLDAMRTAHMVNKTRTAIEVPRDIFSNTRQAPSVTQGVAYITIDTACENTVGGKTQLMHVAAILEKKHKVKPLVHAEEESYRFGPGEPRVSKERWHIPIGIGGKAMIIKTSALEDRDPGMNTIPWLAGQDWLRFMGAVVDIADQKIILKTIGAEAPLYVDYTGHLVVAVDNFPADGWPQGKVATRDDSEKAYTDRGGTGVSGATHIYDPAKDKYHDGLAELERVACTVSPDYWNFTMDHPCIYQRVHEQPRTTRLHPDEVLDGPESRELLLVRYTFKNGASEPIIDLWDEFVEEAPWTGFTIFFGIDRPIYRPLGLRLSSAKTAGDHKGIRSETCGAPRLSVTKRCRCQEVEAIFRSQCQATRDTSQPSRSSFRPSEHFGTKFFGP